MNNHHAFLELCQDVITDVNIHLTTTFHNLFHLQVHSPCPNQGKEDAQVYQCESVCVYAPDPREWLEM